MTKISVLVLDGEIRKTLSVVRSLGVHFNVLVLSKYRFSVSSASRYCNKSFIRNDEDICDQVIQIKKQTDYTYLIATQEETLIQLCQQYKDLVAAGIEPTFPPFEVLDNALNKSKTLKIAQDCGVLVPKTMYPKTMEEVLIMGKSLGFPLVIKPIRSISISGDNTYPNSGPSYAKSEEELLDVVKAFPTYLEVPILQEFISGTGEGGFFLVDKNGEVVSEFAHERIRDVNPKGSGSSFRRSTDVSPEIRMASKKLLKAMNWEGVAMVEFRKSTEGLFYLMEVNGRFWGSLDLARQSGLDFPIELISVYAGKEVKQSNYKRNVYVRWFLGDLLRFIRILKGKPANYPGDYPSRLQGVKELFDSRNFRSKFEVLKWDDLMPFFAEIRSIVK